MFDQALKVAEGIEDEWWRVKALREIAKEMAKAGMFDQALKWLCHNPCFTCDYAKIW
jgi:hypothetical protein